MFPELDIYDCINMSDCFMKNKDESFYSLSHTKLEDYLIFGSFIIIFCLMHVASQTPHVRLPEVFNYIRQGCLVSPKYYIFVLVILKVYLHGFKFGFGLVL